MENFAALYSFELKKIITRRINWIVWGAVLIIVLLLVRDDLTGTKPYYICDPTGNNYVTDTDFISANSYEKNKKAFIKQFEGMEWNEQLFEQIKAGLLDSKQCSSYYNNTDLYPLSWLKSYWTTGFAGELKDADYEHYLTVQHNEMNSIMKEYDLSQEDLEYWQKLEKTMPSARFGYFNTWRNLLSIWHVATIFVSLGVAFMLCQAFPNEHHFKTDAVNLCTKHGRGAACMARIMAGETAAAGFSTLICVFSMLYGIILSGADGFNYPVQSWGATAYHFTMGGAVMLFFALLIVSSLMTGAFVMAISELCKSPIAAMGAIFIVELIALIEPLRDNKLWLTQLQKCIPTLRIGYSSLYDFSLLSIFGLRLNCFEYSFILYAGLTVVFIAICQYSYKKFEVKGR